MLVVATTGRSAAAPATQPAPEGQQGLGEGVPTDTGGDAAPGNPFLIPTELVPHSVGLPDPFLAVSLLPEDEPPQH